MTYQTLPLRVECRHSRIVLGWKSVARTLNEIFVGYVPSLSGLLAMQVTGTGYDWLLYLMFKYPPGFDRVTLVELSVHPSVPAAVHVFVVSSGVTAWAVAHSASDKSTDQRPAGSKALRPYRALFFCLAVFFMLIIFL